MQVLQGVVRLLLLLKSHMVEGLLYWGEGLLLLSSREVVGEGEGCVPLLLLLPLLCLLRVAQVKIPLVSDFLQVVRTL